MSDLADIFPEPVAPRERRPAPTSPGRVPPHNLQAEESLLGAMLLSKDAIAAAGEVGVSAGDFYKPAHGHIFDAITSLTAAGEPADPVTVADALRRSDLLDAIGGPAILVTLQAQTPATSSATRYARIVEELALLRRLIRVAGEIAELGYEVPDDVTKAIDKAESMVFEVAQRKVTDTVSVIGALLDANLDRLEILCERGETVTGVPTGYRDLDEILSGLQPSNLVVVGARPSIGKCLTADARILDPITGAYRTIEEIVRAGERGEEAALLAIDDEYKWLVGARPSAFVDDGIKPVWTVRTRLGREVTTTMAHPFLTPTGWRPLADIAVGTRVAVPRQLGYFGDDRLPDAEVKLLGYLIGDGGLSNTSPRFTNASARILEEVRAAAAEYGVDTMFEKRDGKAFTYRLSRRRGQGANPVTEMLRRHGLMGTTSHTKFVPDAVFRLPKEQAAMFLSRLFATDGSAWWNSGGGFGHISYSTVSKRLAHDVQHLLLRFGLNARLRTRQVKYETERRTAYELDLMTAPEIRRFAAEIGIFSKEAAVERLVSGVEDVGAGYTRDTLPIEIWDQILDVKGSRPWADVSELTGRPRTHNWHVGRRSPRRETVSAIAVALDDLHLQCEAISDIYWDEVVSIEYVGERQVYDLTVPTHHNFIANDICVHNTSFALGMATHAALHANRPVLLFSLEMSQLELSQRILCSEARIDSQRVRTGRLSEADWKSLTNSVGRLADTPLFIDDNPNTTVMEMRAKARRLKSRVGDLGMVIIDYVQLMSGRHGAESRQVEISEISRGLKILARELETPVVALAQLNRQLETRADKRPMLSDLRESGCLTAGTRLLRADTNAEITLGDLLTSKAHDVPVWSLTNDLRFVRSTLTHAFPSGVKPTYVMRMASGRLVEATANHRFRTPTGWSRLDDLDPGSRLAAPSLYLEGPNDLATSDVLWDTVVAIEPIGEQPVYDATVLGTHNFVANGIVAHNSLEQDADVVLFLYRDDVYNADSPDRGTAEVLVAKHRSGPTGKVRLAWLDHYTKFADMAKGM